MDLHGHGRPNCATRWVVTVIDALRSGAGRHADLPAVYEGDRCWSHAELWDRVARLANVFLDSGVRKGDVVMAWLPNCRQAIECELACLAIGGIWVTLNARLTFAEVSGVLRACEPRLCVIEARACEAFDARFFDLSRLPPTLSVGACRAPFVTGEYEASLKAASARWPTCQVGEEDVARYRYTSGTTGEAKAAVLPHRVYTASLQNLQRELHPLGPHDRVLHAAPLTHASGALVFPILAAGGANVIHEQFDLERVLADIEARHISTMFVVPTILQRMVMHPTVGERNLTSLRSLIYGGAPMPESQLREATAVFGQALVHIYGMTEAPWPITTLRQSEHHPSSPHLGSIGKPTSICEVRVADEQGHEVPVGQVGELWIRGPNVMREYLDDPETTRQVLRPDGFLRSGDLGRRTEDGYLYIVDRKKDVIISGGFNVYAKELEMTLCSHPEVAEAAVVGLPHDDWGEIVTAFVVPRQGAQLTPKALFAFSAERMSKYKQPKRYYLRDSLPKNASGKIDKSRLRSPKP